MSTLIKTDITELPAKTPTILTCPRPNCGKPVKGKLGLAMHMARTHGVPNAKPAKAAKPAKMTKLKNEKALHAQAQDHNHVQPHVLFLTGYITAYIDIYSRGHEISATAVARGVGEHLRS